MDWILYWSAGWLGGLLPTFLISRLLLWFMKTWDGGTRRLVCAHGFSFLFVILIGGLGMANGGNFAGLEAAISFSIPQAFWFGVDFLRHRKGLPIDPRESSPYPKGYDPLGRESPPPREQKGL